MDKNFIENQVAKIREQVGDKKVLLGLSGGVDSSVCAALIHKAIGSNLISVFVDHGLLRKGESFPRSIRHEPCRRRRSRQIP